MIYAIPSYKRPKCQTVKTLLAAGVDKANIVISVQTEEDAALYYAENDVEILYREADCAAGNRNTLLEELSGRILLLDDDIKGFSVYENGKWTADTERGLTGIERLFDVAEANNCSAFGISASTNGIVTANRYEYDIDCLLQGTVIGILDNSLRFDSRWKMVEDYEFCLRLMRKNKHLLRANYFCANKPKNGSNEGGLHERYSSGQLPFWITKLHQVYPEFIPNKKKDGGYFRHG